MKKKISIKKIYNIFIFVLIIVIGYSLCFTEDGLFDLPKHFKEIHKLWLFFAIFVHFLNLFLDILLIYLLTNNKTNRYSFKNAIKTSFVGQFFSAITPSATGGQPLQGILMSKHGLDTGFAASAIIQKFFVYQSVMTAYSAFCILLRFEYFNNKLDKFLWTCTLIGFLVQGLVIISILMFVFNKTLTEKVLTWIFKILEKIHLIKDSNSRVLKLENQLSEFNKGNAELFKNKKLMISVYLITIAQLTCMFSIPYFVGKSFYIKVNLIEMICAQSYIITCSSLVPTPGGIGAAEIATFAFLRDFFGEELIKPATLIIRLIFYYSTIFISFPFSRSLIKKSKKKIKESLQ